MGKVIYIRVGLLVNGSVINLVTLGWRHVILCTH